MLVPFHYAFKVKDLASNRRFYVEILGCKEGRSTETWLDFNFFGHQLSAHVSDDLSNLDFCGNVDGVKVPIPHFGCVLDKNLFNEIREKLESASIDFLMKPSVRYAGKISEQTTMFVFDFSGNPIEFKMLNNADHLFT